MNAGFSKRNSPARYWQIALALLAAVLLASAAAGQDPTADTSQPARHAGPLAWGDDYAAALAEASDNNRDLLVWFDCGEDCPACRRFAEVVADPEVAEPLSRFQRVRISTDALATGPADDSAESPPRLLDTGKFAYMYGRHGLAVVSLHDANAPHHGEAISQFPFTSEESLSADELALVLDLPPGSLTERTMIFAVRTHSDHPQSTSGELSPVLETAAAAHSTHQARICRQGHHNWEQRFHQLNAQFPEGLVAREVCAESWQGEELVVAAVGCVHAWRQSPGHWRGVSAAQPFYGYDIQRGKNGIWYATGIFVAPYGD